MPKCGLEIGCLAELRRRKAVSAQLDSQQLRRYKPLERLAEENLQEILTLSSQVSYERGATIFWEGDNNQQACYLLQGEILLTSFEDPRKLFIKHDDEQASLPISRDDVHRFTVIALSEVTLLHVDNSVLDYMSSWDDFVNSDTDSIAVMSHDDQKTQQVTPLTRNGPYVDSNELEAAMELVKVKKGQVIIQQGDPGDYYYILAKGKARVTRVLELAELEDGAAFGEESLLSNEPRNASITMSTDGLVKRISRENFDRLFKQTLIKRIPHEEARRLINHGAVWLDVRDYNEFRDSHLHDARHIPLNELRGRMAELDSATHYVTYCKTGRFSTAAAFLLRRRGFKVSVLDGGLQTLPYLLRQAS
jgi:rhodanese-related sulfurtransferase